MSKTSKIALVLVALAVALAACSDPIAPSARETPRKSLITEQPPLNDEEEATLWYARCLTEAVRRAFAGGTFNPHVYAVEISACALGFQERIAR